MDFRKAFFPTKEELKSEQKILDEINAHGINNFINKGMSQSEAEKAWENHLHFWHSNEARGYYG